MKTADIPISATKTAPTANIRRVVPQVDCDLKNCEIVLNIGFFFDGTNNNKDRDTLNRSDSNIARLYETYKGSSPLDCISFYIPGVGTRFPEIGEYGESKADAGCAFGCEGRVVFALLATFNALHRYCLKIDMFDSRSMRALCRNSIHVADEGDTESLAKLGVQHGLLQPDIGTNKNRNDFLKRSAKELEKKLITGKPRIVECFVDVFGFSRGAAEARVFCNWLNQLLVGGRLAGVSLHFRFVGIIDTVASAGFWSGTAALLANSTGGHGAWASAESLSIPVTVKNCVHMVAMHELRRNFPLDQIGVNGKLQPGWAQHAYPGAHSDVGGGYKPGEFGISVGDDSSKLSQIPLNHMLECAFAAGAPMKKPKQIAGDDDPFAIHPALAKSYEDFINQATLAPRPIYEWLQTYLNWRWQIRNQFNTCKQVTRANQADREVLIAFNTSLINDAAAMMRSGAMSMGKRTLSVVTDIFFTGARRDLFTTRVLEAEAREVFALAQRAKPTPPAFAALFDGYVHDSLAGFNSPKLELTGYWRYRRVFLGSDDYTIASNQNSDTERNIA